MKRLICVGLLVVMAWTPSNAMGWKGSPEPNITEKFDQPYDPAREMAFEGKILRIDPAPCVSLPVSSYHVHLLIGKDPVEIHMGPCWYMAEQKPPLMEGDTITGVGSQSSQRSGERRVIIAREVHRGKQVFRLRDASGQPTWR